jgi:hypothetical protein
LNVDGFQCMGTWHLAHSAVFTFLCGLAWQAAHAVDSPPKELGLVWQRAQVAGILVLKTGEAGSLGGRMPCTPWQLVQVATLASDWFVRWLGAANRTGR